MHTPKEAQRLTIMTGEKAKSQGTPLHELIVREAKKRKLAGATVYRGIVGYGGKTRLRSSKILMLSEDLPIIIEMIDTKDKIENFIPWLEEVVTEGLVTLEPVSVLFYRHESKEV